MLPPAGPPRLHAPTPAQLSFFVASTNDNYGGYRAAIRAATGLAGAVFGTYTFNLMEETEIIVVDWGSAPSEPLRCTPEFRHLLGSVPMLCWGHGADRHCERDLLRIIEVPHDMARAYVPDASVSEVHTFNIAARRARGRILLRLDQDTLPRGPFFSWLLWQKKSEWPDLNLVWWHHRDSGIPKHILPSVIYDLRYYIHREDHSCTLHTGPVPSRPTYNASRAVGHGAFWGETCHNWAVGVYGYPLKLLLDVKGMNERYTYWGGMEAELCTRARLSPKFVSWLDLEDETCGHSFSHIQHEYGERVSLDEHKQNATFDNSEHWGLNNETLLEWVF